MPAMMKSDHQVLLIRPTWTEQHVARYVSRLVSRTLQGDRTFALLNIGDVIQKVTTWKQQLPRVTPFYAVKSNYNPVVLEVLAALGVCFACASMHEMETILSMGVNPDRVIFSHTAKPRTQILYARQHGVDLLTFDGDIELLKIKQFHPNSKLLIRIRCDARDLVNFGEKFGCCAYTEAPELLRIAKDLNLHVVGVSFHLSSLDAEVPAFRHGIQMAARLFESGLSLGFAMQMLDIGGGFPGEAGATITPFAEEINLALDEFFPPENCVEIIAEPGRYFVTSAFTLACLVHSARRPVSLMREAGEDDRRGVLRERGENAHILGESLENPGEETNGAENANVGQLIVLNGDLGVELNGIDPNPPNDEDGIRPEQSHKIMYYMDNGLYGSFAGITSNRLAINPEPLEDLEGPLQPCSLWGPTCDGIDVVARDILLPALPLPSWLLFRNFGAYTSTTSTAFNGFGKPSDYAYATQNTWDILQQLPKIRERRCLVPALTPAELPASFTLFKPILASTHIDDLITSFVTRTPSITNQYSPMYQKASPTSTVASPTPGPITLQNLSEALRSCGPPFSSPSILKPFPNYKINLKSEMLKKNVRFFQSPDCVSSCTDSNYNSPSCSSRHVDMNSPVINPASTPPSTYPTPESSSNVDLSQLLIYNISSKHYVSPATPVTSSGVRSADGTPRSTATSLDSPKVDSGELNLSEVEGNNTPLKSPSVFSRS